MKKILFPVSKVPEQHKKGEKEQPVPKPEMEIKLQNIFLLHFHLHYVAIRLCTLRDELELYSQSRHQCPHELFPDLMNYPNEHSSPEHLLIKIQKFVFIGD